MISTSLCNPYRTVSAMFFWGIFTACVAGCWYHPWHIEEYVTNGPPKDYVGEQLGEYDRFSVNDVIFAVHMKPTDESLYSGSGPYYMRLSAWTEQGKRQNCKIMDVHLRSSQGRRHVIGPAGSLPICLHFEPFNFRYDLPETRRSWVTWAPKRPLNLNFDSGETIEIEIQVVVDGVEGRVTFTAEPRLREGRLRSLGI